MNYFYMTEFGGQFVVDTDGNIASNVAKEECLKYPHSLLTPFYIQVQ